MRVDIYLQDRDSSELGEAGAVEAICRSTRITGVPELACLLLRDEKAIVLSRCLTLNWIQVTSV